MKLQWSHSSRCRLFVSSGIFSPMETFFFFFSQSRCLVFPREAKDPRWSFSFCISSSFSSLSNYGYSISFLCFFFLLSRSCLLCFFLCLFTPTRFTDSLRIYPRGIVPAPVLAGSETVAAFYTPAYIDFPPFLNPTASSHRCLIHILIR